jgi:hypothetical protein
LDEVRRVQGLDRGPVGYGEQGVTGTFEPGRLGEVQLTSVVDVGLRGGDRRGRDAPVGARGALSFGAGFGEVCLGQSERRVMDGFCRGCPTGPTADGPPWDGSGALSRGGPEA